MLSRKTVVIAVVGLLLAFACDSMIRSDIADAKRPLGVGDSIRMRDFKMGQIVVEDQRNVIVDHGEPRIVAGPSRCTFSNQIIVEIVTLSDSGQAWVIVDSGWLAGRKWAFPSGSCGSGSLIKIRL